MDITTKDIKIFNDTVILDIRDNTSYIVKSEDRAIENMKIETDAVGRQPSICSAKEAKILENKVDMNELKSVMGEQFYNYQVMRAVGCSLYATFHGIQAHTGNIAHVAMLKDNIRNLHRIGSESAFGYAITGDIDEVSGMYVVKTPRTKEASLDLTHELFVGLFGTNRLRKVIPNMAMIMGGFKCSEPIFNENKEVTSFCAENAGPDTIPYVIYENITPAESFNTVITKITKKKFLSLYLQVAFATHIGSELIGYTHYDSHSENWLIRTVNVPGVTDKGPFCIPYTNYKTKKVSYIVSDTIATAIDYGMTTIEHNGRNIGPYEVSLQAYGVIDGPWPLHDLYKLLMFLAQTLILSNKNSEVLSEMRKIFRFFNKTETLENAVRDQRKFYYFLPAVQETAQYNVMDLIDYIAQVCDVRNVMLDNPQSHPVLECTQCYTFLGTIRGAYIKTPKPETLLEFYDLASHLGGSSKISYDELVSSFDYAKAANDFKSKVDASMKIISKILSDVRINAPILPQQLTARKLASPTILNPMSISYTKLFEVVSHYEDIETWLKVGMAIAILYSDENLIGFINDIRNNMKKYNEIIIKHIERSRNNYRKILPIVDSAKWDIYTGRYPWYRSRSGDIVHMVNRFNEDTRELFTEERLPSTLIRKAKLHNPNSLTSSTYNEVITEPADDDSDENSDKNNDKMVTGIDIKPANEGVLHPERYVKLVRNPSGKPTGLTINRTIK